MTTLPNGGMFVGTILIVDDDGSNRELMASVCEESGFATVSAGDFRRGADLFREHRRSIVGMVIDHCLGSRSVTPGEALVSGVRSSEFSGPIVGIATNDRGKYLMEEAGVDVVFSDRERAARHLVEMLNSPEADLPI